MESLFMEILFMESLSNALIVFALAAIIIAIVGTRMTRLADEIAAVSGFGQAVIGAVLLGACTSLSGSVTSMSAAWKGNAELAVSNAIGGIAAQTLFLAIADISFRKSNLEHAAASKENLAQCGMLCGLLALPMLAVFAPEFRIFHIHPMTFILIGVYGFGIYQIEKMRSEPMWLPRITRETQKEQKDVFVKRGLSSLLIEFAIMAVLVSLAGYALSLVAPTIGEGFGLSQTLFGTFFTSVTTSLPELITVLVAIRRGAYILAVGNIIGGNTFDVLFLAFSDVTYITGSIYHTMNSAQLFMLALSIVMSSVLLLGLLRREKHGVGGIGFESLSLIVLYGVGMGVLVLGGG